MINTTNCILCGGTAKWKSTHTVLSKYKGELFTCPSCSLSFFADPNWLPEAYSAAISSLDTGIMMRNLDVSSFLSLFLHMKYSSKDRFLDFGAGHGILVRLLRDAGFDFFWTDTNADNLFSRGFEDYEQHSYALTTAVEVLEHLTQPAEFFAQVFSRSQDLFSMTTLMPDNAPADWYYFCLETGQHVAFYQPNTFRWIAQRYGKQYLSYRDYHFLTDKKMNSRQIRFYDLISRFLPVYKFVRKKRGSFVERDARVLLE